MLKSIYTFVIDEGELNDFFVKRRRLCQRKMAAL